MMLVTFYCTYWFSAKLFHYFIMRDENPSMIKTPGEVWTPGGSIFEKISGKKTCSAGLLQPMRDFSNSFIGLV